MLSGDSARRSLCVCSPPDAALSNARGVWQTVAMFVPSQSIRVSRVLLSMTMIVLGSSACSASDPEQTSTVAPDMTMTATRTEASGRSSASNAGTNASVAGKAGSVSTRSAKAEAGAAGVALAEAGRGSAGVAGAAGIGAAGQAAAQDDVDAGMSGAAGDVTIIAEASFAQTAPALTIEGASCAAGRCSLAAPADGKLEVALSLEHNGNSDPMPVLARWSGCGTPSTTFFPVTPSGSSYIINYKTQFSGLHAGSTCSAEIVQGAWLIFAGNMSLKVSAGQDCCTIVQVSEMGLNASCFPPPGTKVSLESGLPRWDCVSIAQDGKTEDMMYTGPTLSLTTAANQVVSCTGAAQ